MNASHYLKIFLASFLAGVLTTIGNAQVPRGLQQAWPRHTVDASSKGADGVRLADANEDGRQDIVTGWEEGGTVRVYLHPGEKTVRKKWPWVAVGAVKSVEDAVLFDMDADGVLDVVSAAEGKTKQLFVHRGPAQKDYLQTAAWRTEALPAAAKHMQWMFVAPAQIDGQYGEDLLAAGKNKGARVGWFEAPEQPRRLNRWRWHPISPAGWVMSLIPIDMDDDGDRDVLLTDRYGDLRGVRWLENPNSAAKEQQWHNHFIGGQGFEVMFMTVADLKDNGRKDVLAATRGDTLLHFQQPVESGDQWQMISIRLPEGTGTGKSVAVGDINQDGLSDIIFSCEHAEGKSGVMWLEQGGKTASKPWIAHEISGTEGTKFDLVELVDIDKDGDLDVLTCEEREGLGVIWYENVLNKRS